MPIIAGAYRPYIPHADTVADQGQVGSITPHMLAVQLQRRRLHLLDLSRSLTFDKGHVPGARFAIRARLPESLNQLPAGDIVLTSEDGVLADLAAPEVAAAGRGVKVLAGGNAAWVRERLPVEPGRGNPLDSLEDEAFWRPYERELGQEEAMEKYLAWEHGLIDQITRDGDARFNVIEFQDTRP
jgi:rhodanese-related sulfurtransferase